MEYIDYLGWILNEKFLQKGADALTMVEPADDNHKEQRVCIKSSSKAISSMKLYCFNTKNTDASNLFSFFNQQWKVEPKAPEGLNSFCDYILLVQHIDGLYVFFLEMKRGVTSRADKQIDASCTFFDFILKSAERIKEDNGFSEFDARQIKYRKLIIKEDCCNKRITKDKDVENFDLSAIITHACFNEFRPIPYCR
ncbi:MAG: hypothetical protein IKN98_02755 [Bacteroidales bacterium]|nr:hypothetical protein [Bacteroidales bacterium]